MWAHRDNIKDATCHFKQCCILKSVDSDEPVHPIWMSVFMRDPEKTKFFLQKQLFSLTPFGVRKIQMSLNAISN